MMRPCSASLVALESNVAQAGRQIADAAAVRNRVTQSDSRVRTTTTMTMKAPVRNADHRVRVLVVNRTARKPVSQALAITMGTPTHATNSETCDNAKMEPVHEVHRITAEK